MAEPAAEVSGGGEDDEDGAKEGDTEVVVGDGSQGYGCWGGGGSGDTAADVAGSGGTGGGGGDLLRRWL